MAHRRVSSSPSPSSPSRLSPSGSVSTGCGLFNGGALKRLSTHSLRAGLGVQAYDSTFEKKFNVKTQRMRTSLDDGRQGSFLANVIDKPELWGLRLRFVDQFLNYISNDINAYSQSHWLDEDNQHVCVSPECRWHHADTRPVVKQKDAHGALRSMTSDMHLVVDRYVKPWTKHTKVGMAPVLNSGYCSSHRKRTSLEHLCKATVFVSHAWGDNFQDFTKALKLSLYLDTVVWICSFAIWQHDDISGLLSDVGECPFARALSSCETVLVISTPSMSVFERCWVVLEAALAMNQNKNYRLCFPDASMTMSGEIQYKVDHLDLTNCSATDPNDKEKIINYAQEQLDGLEQLNVRVRAAVNDAMREAAVMVAAMRGDMQDFLAIPGGLMSWRSMRGRGLVHVTAEYGHVRSLVAILEAIGLDQIDVPDEHGSTPLCIAASSGDLASVACLISLRASVNAASPLEGLSALHFAAVKGDRNICNMLVSSHANLGLQACYLDTDGRRPFDIAIREGHAVVVQDLLSARMDPDSNTCGAHPLFIAAAKGHAAIVSILFNAHADVNALTKDDHRRTALQSAVMNGHAATAHLLLAEQADPNIEDRDGISATMMLTKIISRPTRSSSRFPLTTAETMQHENYTRAANELPVKRITAINSKKMSYGGAVATLAIIQRKEKKLPKISSLCIASPRVTGCKSCCFRAQVTRRDDEDDEEWEKADDDDEDGDDLDMFTLPDISGSSADLVYGLLPPEWSCQVADFTRSPNRSVKGAVTTFATPWTPNRSQSVLSLSGSDHKSSISKQSLFGRSLSRSASSCTIRSGSKALLWL